MDQQIEKSYHPENFAKFSFEEELASAIYLDGYYSEDDMTQNDTLDNVDNV